ncbi:Nitrilase [Elasticomyces elasticus]|uniref:Clr5 domain-containing protein n=1 Tax=Exophiala sideris TaxID=1016849 RepID=A0ABR0JCF9_9EURO|nr:Nitrilase [Elasticomyces elasticus]KAK5030463.1 hypothetical protein LTS07_005247 [Exophiala sideris]KAK5038517.1 Nitrilase [Exophiala sideris]KAK5060399.1 hypothetical protein LTR69_005716 [Exophiala sideris]KAK5183310.1 Nitrilase [Eurotiomycetes sp. CCFEE 6388]
MPKSANRRKPPSDRSQRTRRGNHGIRKPSLKRDKWDCLKETVYKLYIEEDKSFEEVARILSGQNSFEITVSMLKDRTRKWGYTKYFARDQLECAAQEARRCYDNGLNPPVDMRIDGKPVPWDKVKRHFGNDERYTCPWLRDEPEWTIAIGRHALKASALDEHTLIILNEVKYYWPCIFTRGENLALSLQKRKAACVEYDSNDVLCKFLCGMSMLERGRPERGWIEISSAYDAVKGVLRLEQPGLLRDLLVLFSTRTGSIENHDPLFLQMTRYFAATARTVLEPRHPLTRILGCLEEMEKQPENNPNLVAELALQAMVDLVDRQDRQVKIDRWHIYCLENRYLYQVQRRLGRAEATQLLEKRHVSLLHSPAERNVQKVMLMQSLAKMYQKEALEHTENPNCKTKSQLQEEAERKQECQAKAEKLLLQIVEVGELYPSDNRRKGICLAAAEDLGKLYLNSKNFKKSQKYYCRAIRLAEEKFGSKHVYISLLLGQLNDLWRRMEEVDLHPVAMGENNSIEIATSESTDALNVEISNSQNKGKGKAIDYGNLAAVVESAGILLPDNDHCIDSIGYDNDMELDTVLVDAEAGEGDEG